MRVFAVIVSEDDNVNMKSCDLNMKHTVVMAQVPEADGDKMRGKVAIGVAPTARPEGLIALPQNSLWFDNIQTAATYLKGIVEDPNLPKALNLKPLTTASGVVVVNVFPDPVVQGGILNVQMHTYPEQYLPLKDLLNTSVLRTEPDQSVIEVEHQPADTSQPVEEEKVVSIDTVRAPEE